MNVLKNLSSFFKEETVAGLDIGEDYISAACLFPKEDGGIRIENLGWVESEPNASNRAIASRIKKLWQKYHIKTYTVCSCLRSPSLTLKYFKYPNLSKQELEFALQLEAEQTFQRHQKELYIDWHLYSSNTHSSHKESDNQVQEGILIAALKEDIENHLAILEMAGLYPVIMDIACMAISNLFLKLKNPPESEAICLVNVSSHSTDIAILSKGSYIYPRSIYSQPIFCQERADYLVNNIEDVLRYHQFKLHHKPVEKLVFTGKISLEKQFQAGIRKSVELPVEFWNPLEDTTLKENMSAEEIETHGSIMAVSLGLALRRDRYNEF